LDPGPSTSPSSGTFGTGEPGAVDCTSGGKGSISFSGTYGTNDPDRCSSGGEGTSVTTFKFTDGAVTDEAVEFTYGPFQGGALGGSFEGARSSGTFEVTSIDGDCVSKPLTEAHATFRNLVIERSRGRGRRRADRRRPRGRTDQDREDRPTANRKPGATSERERLPYQPSRRVPDSCGS
jgi:hypothetical protein